MKEKWNAFLDKAMTKGKIVFPIVICLAVAVTVVFAMKASGARDKEIEIIKEPISTESSTVESEVDPTSEEEFSLELNTNEAITELITTYCKAVADGDTEALEKNSDKLEDKDRIRFEVMNQYIEYINPEEIYTLPGCEDGDWLVFVSYSTKMTKKDLEYPGYNCFYVSTSKDGNLYFRREPWPNKIDDYVKKVSERADVSDWANREIVKNNSFYDEHEDLVAYLNDVNNEVNRVTGVELAKMECENNENSEASESTDEHTEDPGLPVEEVTYATATSTINVRKSDSEKAEKMGKLARGTKVKVLDQQVNGWSKIEYEKQEAYVMTKFLHIKESVLQYTPIGTVKATSNINVREEASTDAAKLGTMVEGNTAELISEENGWCKIIFEEQIAYVKAEFVERQ